MYFGQKKRVVLILDYSYWLLINNSMTHPNKLSMAIIVKPIPNLINGLMNVLSFFFATMHIKKLIIASISELNTKNIPNIIIYKSPSNN